MGKAHGRCSRCLDDRRLSLAFRKAVGMDDPLHLRSRQGGDTAFDRSGIHISASYRILVRIGRPKANIADSSMSSCRTCNASLSRMGISDMPRHPDGRCEQPEDAHKT